MKDIEVKLAKNEIGIIEKDHQLNKLFEEFLNYTKTNNAPVTHRRYHAIINNFKNYIKQYPFITKISHLSPKLLEDYKSHRKELGASNRTVNMELQMIKTTLNLAIKWGYSKENPAINIRFLKEDKNKKARFLSKEECQILLEKCDKSLYPIFYTFLYTGMRKAELENLKWDDIDFERRKIKIRIKDDWRPKSSEREIPISNGLYDVLKKQENLKKGPYVFHYAGDKIPPNSLRKKLLRITKKCGFPEVTKIHTLRHTFASHLVMNGVDLPTVKKLMGHSDIAITMIYSHLTDDHVDKAVERLDF
ncbi:tyrosine-type recombinase/integrase [bacterium]|nr:tyrosine-type recombinase/integrase [bacterium]